jgi:hypothetical protein
VTTVETKTTMFRTSGAPSAGSMLKSIALHILVLALLMLVPAEALLRTPPPNKQVDIVFYRPPEIAVPAPAVPLPQPRGNIAVGVAPGAPAPALNPRPNAPAGPDGPGKPDLPPGADEGYSAESQPQPQPQPKVGKAGILAFKDKFASLAQDKMAPRLGADARYGAADEVGRASSRSALTTTTPGSSGGINLASLSRSVGGGGGGRGGGGGGGGGGNGSGGGGGDGIPGVQPGRATSSITATDQRRMAGRDLPGPTKKYRSCSIAIRRRSTGCTTGNCAITPH